MNRIAIACLFLTASSCAKDLKPIDTPDSGTMTASHFTVMDLGGGNAQVDVNAESQTDWNYFDLETQKEVFPATPENSTEWDLAFRRFLIRTNSGISGSGEMGTGFVFDETFEQVTAAIVGPYVVDVDDTERDIDTDPDYAFNSAHAASATGWYVYNENDHTLAPTDMVHVVRSVDGNYFKISFTGYYVSGTAGHPAFKLGAIDPPSTDGTIAVDVSTTGFVHVGLAQQAVVNIADPLTSTEWDLGTDEAAWQTNSGLSRAGLGGARIAPDGATWDSLAASPTVGFVTDAMIQFPGAPGSGKFLGNAVLSDWYIYDAVAHTASSKGLLYLVRTAGGAYAKFQILNYDNPTKIYTVRFEPVTRDAKVETAMIDARPLARWTYFSLRLGSTVEVMDSLVDESWDLAFERDKIQTNSGTSGVGAGGAVLAASAELANISMAPADGYVVDTLTGQASGNAVLAGALEFTGSATVAKDAAFVVRAADGTFAKVKILSYEDGVYTIDWAYAGPGTSAF